MSRPDFHQKCAHDVVAPERGHARRRRLRRHQRAEHFPQRREVVLVDALVERLALFARGGSS